MAGLKAGFTLEDIAQLRICEHNTHQVDEKGVGEDGTHLTSCPDHPTYNPEIFRGAIMADIMRNGPIRQMLRRDFIANRRPRHIPVG